MEILIGIFNFYPLTVLVRGHKGIFKAHIHQLLSELSGLFKGFKVAEGIGIERVGLYKKGICQRLRSQGDIVVDKRFYLYRVDGLFL